MNPEPLSELASLYALGTLDEADQSWVDDQYAGLTDFQAEVAELQSVSAMLAYAVDQIPMASNLKERLLDKISANEQENQTTIITLIAQAETANWEPYLQLPGVHFATLRIDAITRQVDCFVRSFGQIKFPEHRHAETEEILVLDGDLKIGDHVYGKGDRIYSQPGTIHQPETLCGCTLFLRTSLDDEIL